MVQDSFVVLSARGHLKRKECTLQTGVSPDIARSRPPLKRMTIRRLQYNSKHHKCKNNQYLENLGNDLSQIIQAPHLNLLQVDKGQVHTS